MNNKLLKRATSLAFEDWKSEKIRENPSEIDKRYNPENKAKFNHIYRKHLADLNRFNPVFDKLKEAIARAKEDRPFS